MLFALESLTFTKLQRVYRFLLHLGLNHAPNNQLLRADLVVVIEPRSAELQNTIDLALALNKRVIVIDEHLGWNEPIKRYDTILDFEDALRAEFSEPRTPVSGQPRNLEELQRKAGADAEMAVPV